MRIRLLFCGLAVALVGLLGPTAAHAQDEGGAETGDVEISEENQHCLELLEEGKDVDDCQEAPSPIFPETNEIIWGIASFVVLFGALAKFGFPAIKKGMEERTARIQADVDAAESAKAEVQAKAAEYDAKLAEARQEAGRLIESARQDAEAYRGDKKADADAEIARLREQALGDIEASKAQAIADIRGEVASLAIAAAEQVVGHSLDRDTNVALIDQFIDSVGAKANN